MEPVGPANGNAATERRLRWVVRLVFYPVSIALVVVAWHQHQAGAAGTGDTPIPAVMWDGTTDRGGRMEAATVDGQLMYFDADLWYECPDDRPYHWRWRSRTADSHFVQLGDAVRGQEGPRDITWSTTSQYGTTSTRIRAAMGDHPHGTLRGEIVRITAPRGWSRPLSRTTCKTGPVSFTLRRR